MTYSNINLYCIHDSVQLQRTFPWRNCKNFCIWSFRGQYFLEPHQLRGYDAIKEALSTTSWAHNLIMACGTGKTWMEVGLLVASQGAKSRLNMDRPDLLIYTENAITAWVIETLERQNIDFWLWQWWKKPADRAVVVASIQVLQRMHNVISEHLPAHIPLIIWDEADLLITKKRRDFLDRFDSLRIGFSATDTWSDGRSISDAWGPTIYRYDLAEAIADKVVLRPRYQLLQSSVSMNALPGYSWDYPIEDLDQVLMEAEVYRGIVAIYDSVVWKEKMSTHPTIVAVPSVNLVRRTAAEFRKKYGQAIRIRWWTGEDSTGATVLRNIEEYRWWEVDILIVCQMGGRGMNLPNARVMIDASCTASLTKISQLHPRVMRRDRDNPDCKPDCTIIQIVPTTKRSKPKTFFDIIEPHRSRDRKIANPEGWPRQEGELIESLAPDVLERLRRDLDVVDHHSLRLVGEFEMETEKSYELLEDGTIMLDDGRIFAPIEYFMKIFGIATATVVKKRIERYISEDIPKISPRSLETDELPKSMVVNLNIDNQVRMKRVYAVSPITMWYKKEIGSTLYVDDSSSIYTDASGKKYYTKTGLKSMTWTRPNDDFTQTLTPLSVRYRRSNKPLDVYAYDDYIDAIRTHAVYPDENGAYIHKEYQDMTSLEGEFPELTSNFSAKQFASIGRHKPWNPQIWRIEYITLVSIEGVRRKYSYLRSLSVVDKTIWVVEKWGVVYLTKQAIENRYNTEAHILERFRSWKFARIPARIWWVEVEIFPEKEIADAHATMLRRQARSRQADEGVYIIDGKEYYTTSYIATRYGFANSQVIDLFRENAVAPASTYWVQVYLFLRDDTERIFEDVNLYPNTDGELITKNWIYIGEKYLTKIYWAAIALASLTLAPRKWIASRMAYSISRGGKERGLFYEKIATIDLAEKLRNM